MITAPAFVAEQGYVARRGDADYWRPCLAEMLKRHQTPCQLAPKPEAIHPLPPAANVHFGRKVATIQLDEGRKPMLKGNFA